MTDDYVPGSVRYYLGHEEAYQRIKAAGGNRWARDETFDQFYMRAFIERTLPQLALAPGARVLEVGTGTGPGACFLAEKGFAVTGIDVSETAIAMARDHAAERAIDIRFEVADWLTFGGDPFDLIVDGHCLHCIVHDEHRRQALTNTRRLLAPGGTFLIETMVFAPNMQLGPMSHYEESTGIVWAKVPLDRPWERRLIGDTWFTPTRRILSAELLEAELILAGMRVTHMTLTREDPRHPANVRAICEHAT
jgi:2-polyprenyl-3-methyl-5-hydroxy-6-metoxy-1,4-benzoquinol methylase